MRSLGSEVAVLLEICRAVGARTRRALARGAAVREASGRSAGDVQYRIDRLSEAGIEAVVARAAAALGPVRLMTEGLPPEGVVVGGRRGDPPRRRLLLDPIDGTRGLMYGKRSAFVLAGFAPETPAPRFRDLTAAVVYEIAPPPGCGVALVGAAARGRGVRAWRERASTSGVAGATARPTRLRGGDLVRPSDAATLAHGFATFNRFLDGAQDRLGFLAEEFFARALRPRERGHVFEDQYICNGGQMMGVLLGRDRFVADLRPYFRDRAGRRLAAAHPYDVLGALLLEEAGCPLEDGRGGPFDPPLDVVSDVAWVAYANPALRRRLAPCLAAALRAAGV